MRAKQNEWLTVVRLSREQLAGLRELSQITGVPMSIYIRQGVDYVLTHRSQFIPALPANAPVRRKAKP